LCRCDAHTSIIGENRWHAMAKIALICTSGAMLCD